VNHFKIGTFLLMSLLLVGCKDSHENTENIIDKTVITEIVIYNTQAGIQKGEAAIYQPEPDPPNKYHRWHVLDGDNQPIMKDNYMPLWQHLSFHAVAMNNAIVDLQH